MAIARADFLRIGEKEFSSLEDVTSYITDNVDLGSIDGDLSVIGSVSDFQSRDEFIQSSSTHFSLEQQNGDLLLFNARKLDVPYYLYWDDDFPVWFTTGRKTEDIPETIDEYLKSDPRIGRLWISKTEMEDLRQRIVQTYPNVLMTYFTATRSRHSEVDAQRRPRYERTFQYYGKDALETFNEVKYEYGVLPTNLKFQRANDFKFRVTKRGIFTVKNGGLGEVLTVIRDSIDRLQDVKEAIDSSEFSIKRNKFAENNRIPQSRPWEVQLQSPLTERDINRFEGEELREWEFTLSELRASFEGDNASFQAELLDDRTLGRTKLLSKDGSIRIYPREETGIDQSVRVYEFINDQIDPSAFARRVT
jgi:hypothetical protein